MENFTYTDYLSYFEEKPIDNKKAYEEQYAAIKSLVDDGTITLAKMLNGALNSGNSEHIDILVEAIRRDYLLHLGGSALYKLLLQMALDFTRKQINQFDAEEFWNVKQVMDIELHQSHHVSNSDQHRQLFFELCYELLDPRLKEFEDVDKYDAYGSCLYFVMRTDGTFKNDTEQLTKLQPRIQRVIEQQYGPDHHFSKRWIKLFETL